MSRDRPVPAGAALVAVLAAVVAILGSAACDAVRGRPAAPAEPGVTRPAGRLVGVVRVEGGVPAPVRADLYVRLEDVGEADAASRVLAEYVRRDVVLDPGTDAGLPFELVDVPPTAGTGYAVTAHVDVDRNGTVGVGDFVTQSIHPPPPEGGEMSVVVRRV